MNASGTTYALVGEALTPAGTARSAVVVKDEKSRT
jgi:hypothetical protein